MCIKLSLENNWPTNRNKQEIVDFNLNNKPYRYIVLHANMHMSLYMYFYKMFNIDLISG